ncbi:hypothetical protein F1188_15430 [Roseospira marina]|uniref:Uncharacterized protein n=1 Tax=Roseospira marina TaxID=140057 RepID=A0A5M6I8U1_9PROT|nr:hypothetical protein [Roseospira marina]KAA5604601.1 hypothetical protein F1188_15430 [Roseospira marina]MBB4315353.1 hypothetical protein [Roseospira marina]MBB5088352.1 hypothetical protein [Roseospira marina]
MAKAAPLRQKVRTSFLSFLLTQGCAVRILPPWLLPQPYKRFAFAAVLFEVVSMLRQNQKIRWLNQPKIVLIRNASVLI